MSQQIDRTGTQSTTGAQSGPPPAPPVPSTKEQKKPKEYKLKHGKLEVVGYTFDEPMVIKIKCTLRTGVTKLVCKYKQDLISLTYLFYCSFEEYKTEHGKLSFYYQQPAENFPFP